MVYIKNIFSITLAFIVTLIVSEAVIRLTINHPVSNISSRVYGMLSYNKETELYYPYSRYWTVEGGYKIGKTNNLGLTGNDVIVNDTCKYILILGSSYAESRMTKQDSIASSVLQSKIGNGSKYQVINLGYSGLTPYDVIYRLNYYTKIYNPELIIYLMEGTTSKRIGKNISMDFSNIKIQNDKLLLRRYTDKIREYSSLLNLFINTYVLSEKNSDPFIGDKRNMIDTLDFTDEVFTCLKYLNDTYKNKFSIVSVINSEKLNKNLKDFCETNNVLMEYEILNKKGNKLNDIGHLNNNGNFLLGELYYKIFIKYKERNEKI
jgi:hypothetical protein